MADPTMADVFRAIIKIREETPDLAWMLDYPAVAKILIRRAAGQIDDQKFKFELQKTKFWRTTSDATRQWLTLVNSDPAKATRQRQQMETRVRQLMGQLGITLGRQRVRIPGKSVTDKEKLRGGTSPAKIADLALRMGWNEDQVTNYLLSFASFGQEGRNPTGGVAVAMSQMRRLEEQYGLGGADRQRFRKAKRILSKKMDLEGYEEELRRRALARYGDNETLAGVLERGGTLEDWFGDYRQMISQELEIPASEISLTDQRWQQVLMHNDGQTVRPMTFAEAQKFVRTRPEWADTTNGRQAQAQIGNTLLNIFGKRKAA